MSTSSAVSRHGPRTLRKQRTASQIRRERDAYYDILEATQKADLNITAWLEWFLGCLDRAFDGAESLLGNVLKKAQFWEAHAGKPINERQRKVINRLLDGFEAKLTSSKWAKLTKTSQDTAGRDIDESGQARHPDQGYSRRTKHQLLPQRGQLEFAPCAATT
jgi:Fic family protein